MKRVRISEPPLLRQVTAFRRRRERLRELRTQIAASTSLRVVVGSGQHQVEGWLGTDQEVLSLLYERDWRRLFAPESIYCIFAEHVWEHLEPHEATDAVRRCYRYLRPDGRLRLAVPDGFHPDPAYIAAVQAGGTGAGAHSHKVLYNFRTITTLLREAGFTVQLLEYFDEAGAFHASEWSSQDGLVRRSARHDERNAGGILRYTSLIADGIKRPCGPMS